MTDKPRVKVKKAKKGTIPLGILVRDKVTGLEGVTVSRTKWLYGVDRYNVQPRAADSKIPDQYSIDVHQLEIVMPMQKSMDAHVEQIQTVMLGSKVRDLLSNLVGTVTGRCVYLTGCSRIGIESEQISGQRKVESWWTDEEAVDVLDSTELSNIPEAKTGGVGRF